MNKKTISILLASAMTTTFISCKKDNNSSPDQPAQIETKTCSNIFANDSTGHYTFYNLRTNAISSLSDSATLNWDIALRGTTILINGGTSGPGAGKAAVVENGFDNVTTAPDDNLFLSDTDTSHAIASGSGNGWYNYDPVAFVITPIPGRTLVIKTADGKYAKMEILSYYKDAPSSPTMNDVARYYKFRFALQTDGTKNLK